MRDGGRPDPGCRPSPAPGTKTPPCGWGTEGFTDDFSPLLYGMAEPKWKPAVEHMKACSPSGRGPRIRLAR